MNPTQLRSWIRRYGNAGVLLVGGYLGWRYLWTERRATLIGSVSAIIAAAFLLWPHAQLPRVHKQPPLPMQTPAISPQSQAPLHPLGNIKILLSKPRDEDDYERTIGAMAGKQILWKDTCFYANASVAPHEQTVYYATPEHNLIARRYDGRILWQRDDLDFVRGIWNVRTGGDALFVHDDGPAYGIGIYHPESWEGEDGVIGSCEIYALDCRNGKTRWQASAAEVGEPIWTNGDVFLAVRLDVSAQAIQQVKRSGASLPMWIELRRVRDHQRLWKRRLRGYPPGLTSIRQVGKNRFEFLFANKSDYGMNEFDFAPHTGPTAVVVPLKHPHIESGGLRPSVSGSMKDR